MSGELKFQSSDGVVFWFGRDDHYPDPMRMYGRDTRRRSHMTSDDAHSIVKQGLSDGEVHQGDAVRFFFDADGEATGGDE